MRSSQAEIQAAFAHWQAQFPKKIEQGPRSHTHTKNNVAYTLPRNWHGDCDCIHGTASHVRQLTQHYRDGDGIGRTSIKMVKAPDSQVCERERSWRMYTSLRDGRNYMVSG